MENIQITIPKMAPKPSSLLVFFFRNGPVGHINVEIINMSGFCKICTLCNFPVIYLSSKLYLREKHFEITTIKCQNPEFFSGLRPSKSDVQIQILWYRNSHSGCNLMFIGSKLHKMTPWRYS